jgi:hypothetical protein
VSQAVQKYLQPAAGRLAGGEGASVSSCRDHDCVAYAVDNGGCPNFDCDWAVPHYLVGGPLPDEGPEPYIANAQFHLDSLSQTVNDALISQNDECLKTSLFDDITAIDINLQRALRKVSR